MEETLTSTPRTSWITDAAKKGAILGVIHIMIHLILFIGFPSKLSGFSYLFVILVINIVYGIVQGHQWRREVGGFISYGAVFKYVFVMLAVNGLVNLLYMVIFLFAVPSYPGLMAQSQLDTSLYWAEKFGAPEATIEQMSDQFDFEEIEGRFGFGGIFVGYLFGLIFYALGALIIALFVRRNQPEVM